MRVPLGWLAEWIELPPAREALVERLTLAGLEVGHVERTGPELPGIVVGAVLECAPHPNADRLSLCRVDRGAGEPARVVCGAPNVAAGQKVAFAAPGTALPDGRRLERARIRGVVSEGMICSARELGLGDEHEGILVLDPRARVGAPLAEALGAGETVLEVEITPNRGDWASLLGIAREVRALFGGELRCPPSEPAEAGAPAAEAIRIALDDPEGCPAYLARVVRGLRLTAAPPAARARLEAAGLRSLDAVVDATNLVLLEFGQPLHAFDLASLRGGVIRVRRAGAGEKLVTLDGQTRELSAEDLVIADAERPVAIAGVMGGAETQVTGGTRDVLLECALFHPRRVRRTARRLGLHTEASYRFERGVDREGLRRALDRSARLLAEWCGGAVAPGVVEARGRPLPATEELRFDPERANRLLGTRLSREEVAALLARVEVTSRPEPDGRLRCRVPSHRNDLHGPEDLVEEVGRVHGYERIPATLPVGALEPARPHRRWRLVERARSSLAAQGLSEAVTLPFRSPADAERLGIAAGDPRRRAVRLQNPLVEEEGALRTSLLPSLLRAAQGNLARQVEEVRLFEIGPAFLAGGGEGGLPAEPLELAGVWIRGERPALWEPRERIPLFYLAKGVAERVLFDLGYGPRFRPEPGGGAPQPYLHPGAACRIDVGERCVGAVGELHPAVAAGFGIEVACALFEIELAALADLPQRTPAYREVSWQPRVRRDLAVLLPAECAAGEVLEAMRGRGGPHLVSAEVFDRYEGPGVPEGKVSLAFRLVFQRADRALTDAEVNGAMERVVEMLSDRFGGRLR